jgi:beta-phosphoglucomutase-like phosphatase (HAD superfamily)
MELSDPKTFYDCIITAGFPLGRGEVGTLGELEAKPHPWLYAETAYGLGLGHDERNCVVGIEDSGAGVCAVRLAGFYTVGISGGNILQSGTKVFCNSYHDDFVSILDLIESRG